MTLDQTLKTKNYSRRLRLATVIFAMAMVHAAATWSVTPAWGDLGGGSYANPVLCADFSDPDVIRVGDTYYMVASDFHYMGMQVLESRDLVNWNYCARVYDRLPHPAYDTNDRYAGGSWAPAIREHAGRYYVYFCTPHEGLYMCTADHPRGPWSAPLLVKAVERWEDPCPFWDEDGSAYLGHSLHGAGPIIMHRMSPDGTRLLDDGREVYRGPVAEGTKIHKLGGYYYLSIPEGGVGRGWQTLLRATDIYGPYERREVLHQGPTDINGPHQGALVDTPSGEWWFLHFQETPAQGRVVHLQPVTWGDDGWPRFGVDIDGDGIGEPVQTWSMPQGGRAASSQIPAPAAPASGNQPPHPAPLAQGLATSDEFDAPAMGLQWQWNHNPVDSAWSLSDPAGCLTLTALTSPDLRQARNTLTQKAVGHRATYTTALLTDAMAEGQRCGLACLGKGMQMLGARMHQGQLQLYTGNDTVETVVATLPGGLRPVYLRLHLDFPAQTYTWSYSTDGKHYTQAGTPFYLRWGYWKGVRPALYSYNTLGMGGKARYQWIRCTHDGNNPPPADPAEEAIVEGIARTSFPDRTICVAPGSVAMTDLQALQQAVDSCSEAGGGHVCVAPGQYTLDGTLTLKSNVDLHLAAGAVLQSTGRASDFLPPVFTRWEGTELYGHSPLIYALHANNIAITGRGTIDGAAAVEMAAWAEAEAADRDRLRAQGETLVPVRERVYGEGTILRPTCVELIGCSRVLIEDVTIKDSPFWTVHPVYCDNVVVSGVTIDSHFANNDGCDPESTSNVLIEHCLFNVGDDAIAVKSGRDADGRSVGRPSERIVIRDCVFRSECNGLCIGSEMSGGVAHLYMHDIRIGTVKNAIYFKSNRDRGGYIRDVHVRDITVDHTLGAVLRFETNYFGFRGGAHASQYEDFTLRNIHARLSDHYGLFISGYPEKPVRRVTVERMTVESAPERCYTHCADGLRLSDVTVSGVLLPETPVDDPVERTLDVY